MGSIAKKATWKPIDIDSALLLRDGTEGLIGIEECTDYDINEFLPYNDASNKTIDLKLKPAIKTSKKSKKIINVEKLKQKVKKRSKNKEQNHVQEQNELHSPSKSGSTITTDIISNDEEEENHMQAWDLVPLPKTIINGLATQKFYQPTEIQSLTLPAAILGRRDILGAAETGSGKTLAFGLPILAGILKLKEECDQNIQNIDNSDKEEEESDFEEQNESVEKLNSDGLGCVKSINNVKMNHSKTTSPLYALILTPTRELAVQIKNHLIAAAKYTDIKVAVVVGGMASVKQERILSKGPEIVVATPGRLWELIQQGNGHLSQIDDISYLAIDETDRMIERGHFQELHLILERLNINDCKKRSRQNFVFSATLTLIHELPTHLVTKKKLKARKNIADMTKGQKLQNIVKILGITNPKVVDITKAKGTSGTLTECRITCDISEKDYYVYYFLQRHPGRTLIFCNSIGCVKRLTTLLGLLNCSPLPLHASMQQRQRLKNLDRFTEKDNSILVATDVAARGLDIPCIDHVIHYQTPRTSESYVHRSGRTARAASEGITVLLVEPSELPNYFKLCRTLEKTEDIPLFPIQDNYLNAVKKRVALACEVDKLDLQVRKANSESGWFQKAAEEMDMIIDEVSLKYDSKESKTYKKVCDIKRKQLAALLQKPIFPRGFSGKYPLSSNLDDLLIAQGNAKTEKAITVMKNAIEVNAKDKRRRPKMLFKPKIQKSNEKIIAKDLVNNSKGKFKKNKNHVKQQFRKHKK